MNNVTTNNIEFTRINNDVNGNPRYVCHYTAIPLTALDLSKIEDKITIAKSLGQSTVGMSINLEYQTALIKARKIGGKKFHNKQYGGGIVFQSYNIDRTAQKINELVNG